MPSDEADAAKPRRLTLEEMKRATEEFRRRANIDVRTTITKEDFDALWDEPHGDFSLTDVRSAL